MLLDLHNLYEHWQLGHINDAEMAVRFFLINHAKKYPSKRLVKRLTSNEEVGDILRTHTFKKVKSKALVALVKWLEGQWENKLYDRVLSPYEVLRLQVQGIRPVSMLIHHQLETVLHKEDELEFFLHDLEHSYMFHFDSNLHTMQRRFFKNIENSLDDEKWKFYMKRDGFKEKFFYVISDMNTHEEHYRAYLKSIVDVADMTWIDHILETREIHA